MTPHMVCCSFRGRLNVFIRHLRFEKVPWNSMYGTHEDSGSLGKGVMHINQGLVHASRGVVQMRG